MQWPQCCIRMAPRRIPVPGSYITIVGPPSSLPYSSETKPESPSSSPPLLNNKTGEQRVAGPDQRGGASSRVREGATPGTGPSRRLPTTGQTLHPRIAPPRGKAHVCEHRDTRKGRWDGYKPLSLAVEGGAGGSSGGMGMSLTGGCQQSDW